jgi:Mycothiol maleylpyruvate isomerase N-terminal domain
MNEEDRVVTTESVVSVAEAVRRTELDRRLLVDEIAGRSDEALVAPYAVNAGPLGDACDSLRDLVAHVLMWDEISLAVLSEARAARRHWSLDPRWETREAGQMLNVSGVAAGRELPVGLLLHRFASVREALLAELRSYSEEEWRTPVPVDLDPRRSVGSLAEYVMTVPGQHSYWHAAIHLHRLSAMGANHGR